MKYIVTITDRIQHNNCPEHVTTRVRIMSKIPKTNKEIKDFFINEIFCPEMFEPSEDFFEKGLTIGTPKWSTVETLMKLPYKKCEIESIDEYNQCILSPRAIIKFIPINKFCECDELWITDFFAEIDTWENGWL